jgi:hypothetical protein
MKEEREVKIEEVKINRSSKNNYGFYLAIFNFIKNGKSPSFISKTLGVSKQKIHYYTNILKKNKIIDKHSNGNWFVKVKTFSLGTRPKSNLHAFQIYIPILEGKIDKSDWEIKEELKNWTPTYKTFKDFDGITIKNNNNKSITLFIHTREIKDLNEIDVLGKEVVNWALETFWRDFKVKLDKDRVETKMLHIATEDNQSEDMLKSGEKFELNLNKKAEKVFPKDKIDAKAWLDGSPFSFTAETNDKEWKREYLSMPFNISDLKNAVMYIAKNYDSHVGIVEKLNKLLDNSEVKRHIRIKVKEMKQTKLGDWF